MCWSIQKNQIATNFMSRKNKKQKYLT
jgi:hypothetical protein